MARVRKLIPERKESIDSFLKATTIRKMQKILKDLLVDILQGMIESKLDEYLGYSKYDYKEKDNQAVNRKETAWL